MIIKNGKIKAVQKNVQTYDFAAICGYTSNKTILDY